VTSDATPARSAPAGDPDSAAGGRGGGKSTSGSQVTAAVLRAVALRPTIWVAAAAEAVRLAPSGWWRRWPPRPWPDAELWRFRMETAYGGAGNAVPRPGDVRSFLQWCRDMRKWRRV